MHFAVQKHVFLTLKWQNSLAAGAGPRWGAYDAPPDPLVGWRGDTPPQTPTPLSALGASILAPRIRAFGAQFWRSHSC